MLFAAGRRILDDLERVAVGVFDHGDFDGDGLVDVALGAPGYSQEAGAAYVFLAPLVSATTADADMTVVGEQQVVGDNEGDSVGIALTTEDLDGDGVRTEADNCPNIYNPAQEDNGSMNPTGEIGIGGGSSGASYDGIGDACQCGEGDGDGVDGGDRL